MRRVKKKSSHLFSIQREQRKMSNKRKTPPEFELPVMKTEKKEEEDDDDVVCLGSRESSAKIVLQARQEKPQVESEKSLLFISLVGGGVFKWKRNFLTKNEADSMVKTFVAELPWVQSNFKLFGRILKTPRMQCLMADESVKIPPQVKATPWRSDVVRIKERLERMLQCKFDYLLLELYRNGKDYLSYRFDADAMREVRVAFFLFYYLLLCL